MAKPFLKWVGGKQQLLKHLHNQLPRKYDYYIEPFLGGGALFFSMFSKKALIADSNAELINAYIVVRDNLDGLIEALRTHVNDSDYYYKIRALKPYELSSVDRASRFIYLNKTCYNGLYRVNSKNEFNVPFGKYKNPTICDSRVLKVASRALQGVNIQATYFQNILTNIPENSFVYLDPPYLPVKFNSFVSYSKKGFGLEEHEALASCFEALTDKGVKILLSNSNTDWVIDRYSDYKIIKVNARRSVNSNGKKRGDVTELLIRNY